MASKEMTVREWECDGCGSKVRADAKSRDLPSGWTNATTTFDSGYTGDYTKGLDLCPACAKNPEAAADRWKASLRK